MASYYHRVLRQVNCEVDEVLLHPEAVNLDAATLTLLEMGAVTIAGQDFTLTEGIVDSTPEP